MADDRIIVKLNFNFKGQGGPLPRCLEGGAGWRDNPYMPEALDVTCPCCGTQLKVDPETSAVVWHEKRKGPAQDFDDLVQRAQSQKSVLEEKFARSMQQTKNQREILDRKFEEAKKRAADDPTRPPHPFDNE